VPEASGRDVGSLLEMPPGTELGVSEWHKVTQEDINAFAKLTRDEDPYHTEPAWAREHSPLGTTIAFGFLTLSMLTCFLHQVFDRIGIRAGEDSQLFNFGFNRVRLPEPVPAGAEIRGRFALDGSKVRQAGGIELTFDVIVEIKGKDRPALVAQWLGVAVTESGTGQDR
jgi:acyl dehydratase